MCAMTFGSQAELSAHLRAQDCTCVITEEHRPRMLEMRMKECDTCHKWFATLGNHSAVCRPQISDSDESEEELQPEAHARHGPCAPQEMEVFTEQRL